MQDRPITADEMNQKEVLGSVRVKFMTYQPLHIKLNTSIKNSAYKKLLTEAKKQYQGKVDVNLIDIRNIDMQGKASVINFTPIGWLTNMGYFANWQTVTATGDVVINSVDTRGRVTGASKGIEGAIYRAAEKFVAELPASATVAVLSIASRDNAEYIIEELEFRLEYLGAAFSIVDRRGVDAIRREQEFQMSGDVSDESAVGIGKLLGATIVIIGSTSGEGKEKRLSVRALDVQTARVVSSARELY
ncbi:hypothetical protein Holit_00350 [Hollandina sp. SP2]